MTALPAAAGDTDGRIWVQSSSSSYGELDLGLYESHPRYNRRGVHPESSRVSMSNMGRLLCQGSQLGPRTTEDDVIVMDGVVIANGSASGSRRYASSSDLGYVHTGPPGISGRGRYGSNRQFSYGRAVARAMNPIFSENRRSMQVSGSNMQAFPRPYYHFPPQSLPAIPLPTLRGATATHIRPPAAPYFKPPTAAATIPARAPAGSSWVLKQFEVKPPPAQRATTFSWPPTEEEDAAINHFLYGPRRTRRLPVFASICPA